MFRKKSGKVEFLIMAIKDDKAPAVLQSDNQKFINYLATLVGRKFCGEIVLYFNGGVIESCRTSERIGADDAEEFLARKEKETKKIIVKKND